MTISLKIYFGVVEPNTAGGGIEVIEKMQHVMTFSDDAVAKAKNMKAIQARYDAIKPKLPSHSTMPDAGPEDWNEYKAAFGELDKAKREVKDILKASGIVISKFCEAKVFEYLASR